MKKSRLLLLVLVSYFWLIPCSISRLNSRPLHVSSNTLEIYLKRIVTLCEKLINVLEKHGICSSNSSKIKLSLFKNALKIEKEFGFEKLRSIRGSIHEHFIIEEFNRCDPFIFSADPTTFEMEIENFINKYRSCKKPSLIKKCFSKKRSSIDALHLRVEKDLFVTVDHLVMFHGALIDSIINWASIPDIMTTPSFYFENMCEFYLNFYTDTPNKLEESAMVAASNRFISRLFAVVVPGPITRTTQVSDEKTVSIYKTYWETLRMWISALPSVGPPHAPELPEEEMEKINQFLWETLKELNDMGRRAEEFEKLFLPSETHTHTTNSHIKNDFEFQCKIMISWWKGFNRLVQPRLGFSFDSCSLRIHSSKHIEKLLSLFKLKKVWQRMNETLNASQVKILFENKYFLTSLVKQNYTLLIYIYELFKYIVPESFEDNEQQVDEFVGFLPHVTKYLQNNTIDSI